MSTFKTYLRILLAHRTYIAIYLILMSSVGIIIGLMNAGSQAETFRPASVSVAVIDRDESDLSRALAEKVQDGNNAIAIADEKRVIQDALARDTVSYLLVIPEGWGAGLMDAAAKGTDAPSLETYVSFQSGRGRLLDLEVTTYANALYGNAATLGGTQEDVAEAADAAWGENADVSMIARKAEPLPQPVTIAAEFSAYPVFASVSVCIAVLMATINKEPVRKRRLAAPEPAHARNRALFAVCAAIALAAWVWNFGLQLLLLGQDALRSSPVQMAIIGCALLVYALVSAAIGFLVGQLGCSENASNAIANIFGMLFSYLGGGWTGLALFPASVIAVARFTPSYWCARAIEGASGMAEVTAASAAPLLGYVAICALFGLAILLVGLVVGRARSRGETA